MKEPMKLFYWSTMCMLSTILLDNFTPSEPPVVEILFLLFLVVLPGIGTALGVMSWRKEGPAAWTIGLIIAINILLVILGLVGLILTLSAG